MGFTELRLAEGDTPEQFFLDLSEKTHPHRSAVYRDRMVFFDEPWHPGCWIVRLDDLNLTEQDIAIVNARMGYDSVEEWDEEGDVKYLGPEGFALLCQAAKVRDDLVDRDPLMVRKYIHCMLNTWGYSRWEEAKFCAYHSLLAGMMVFFNRFTRDEVKALQVSKKVLHFFKLGRGPSGSQSPWVKTRKDSPSTK